MNGLLAQAYEAQGVGQGRLDAAEAARVQAASDAAVLGAFNDPTANGSDPASILAAAQGAGLDPDATLDLQARIVGAAEANPGIFNPQAPVDPILDAACACFSSLVSSVISVSAHHSKSRGASITAMNCR